MNQFVPCTPRLGDGAPPGLGSFNTSSPAAVVPQINLNVRSTKDKGKSPLLTGSFQIISMPEDRTRSLTPIDPGRHTTARRGKPTWLLDNTANEDQIVPCASPSVGCTPLSGSPAKPSPAATRGISSPNPEELVSSCKPTLPSEMSSRKYPSRLKRRKPTALQQDTRRGSHVPCASKIDLFSGDDIFA